MLRLCSGALFVIAILVGVFGRYGTGHPTEESIGDEEVDDFWTEERLNAAKPLELDEEAEESSTADPERSVRRKRYIEPQYLPTKSVGKLYFVTSLGASSCAATVVAAPSKSLIVTSAECLYNRTGKAYYKNMIFVPAEDGGYAPLQLWPAKSPHVTNAFIQAPSVTVAFNEAVGFVVLNKVGGKAVADATGSQKISFSKIRNQFTYLFTYSGVIGGGSVMSSCLGKAMPPKCGSPTDPMQSLQCALSPVRGSPWIEQFNATDGIGTVTSVSTSVCASPPYIVNGPLLNDNVKALYDLVKSKT